MFELMTVNELSILFRPNRLVGLIRNITRSIFELLGIEQNIRDEPILFIPPIVRIDFPELNIEPLNLAAPIIQQYIFNPPAINPVLVDHFLKAEERKPKIKIHKEIEEMMSRINNKPLNITQIMHHDDSTFYATETPGVFSNNRPF